MIKEKNPKNFYELFKEVNEDIEHGRPYDVHKYRNQAERIASSRAGSWFIVTLALLALLVVNVVIATFTIVHKNQTIAGLQHTIETPAATNDSINFQCRKCGIWYDLAAQDTLMLKNFKKKSI